MFLNLLIIVMIVAPFPAIYVAISKRAKPFSAIGYGVGAGTIAVLVIFAVAFIMGQSFGGQMEQGIKMAVDTIMENKDALSNVGLDEISNAKAISILTDTYKSIAMLLPSVLIIFITIISYIEYNLTVRARYRQSSRLKPYAYLRNFGLTNNDVLGWFMIYIVSYLMKFAGVGIGEIAVMNINIMVNMVIAVQAFGLIFYVAHMKQRPRIFPILISVCLWFIPMGHSILFILGLLDLLLNLRVRLNNTFNN